ncbi:MAG: lipopolysaccharide kinase InaA family protein [Phycisphaerales bacterium]
MDCRNIIVADNFPQSFESSNIQIPDGMYADFEKLNSSKFALVLKVNTRFNSKVYSIILKRYFLRNISDFFKSIFLPSRAERAYKAGQMLLENGFLTPPAVAYSKKFLMTMEVRESTQIFNLLRTLPPEKKKNMIEQFAIAVGKMHDKGIFHGDLRIGNILVKENNENFEFYLIDNERTKKFDNIPWRLRIKNLVQLNMHKNNVDESERKLFFDIYLTQQSKPVDARKLAEAVIAKTNKRLEDKIKTTNERE